MARAVEPALPDGNDGDDPAAPAARLVPLGDVAQVRALLIASARARRPISYADLLMAMGYRFTRPRMRAVCRTLDAIDAAARTHGEPDLAVLVVRESDGLPGQGWWSGETARRLAYDGAWTGPQAAAFVSECQVLAFDHWATPSSDAQM